MKKTYLISLGLLFVVFSACMNASSKPSKVTVRCDSIGPSNHQISQCYKQEIGKYITRRINSSVRGLTQGDWPFDYQFIYEIYLSPDGSMIKADVLKVSSSHRLNKALTKAIKNTSSFHVPQNDLFVSGGFERLRLVIIPSRTPILGDEKVVDADSIVIYLTELCSLRSDRC